MLVIMAGLPGSGKSTIAAELARILPVVIIDKDIVRAGLFPAGEIEYSTRQDDFVVAVMLQVAQYYYEQNPQRIIIFDGRPFIRRYQIEQVTRFAEQIGQEVRLIACTCSDDTAREPGLSKQPRLENTWRQIAASIYTAACRLARKPTELRTWWWIRSARLGRCVQQCIDYIQRESD
jgi:predicted kinase